MGSSRRNSTTSTSDQLDHENSGDDIANIIEDCSKNLKVLDSFILKSKESIRERQTYQTAIQNIQSGLRNILLSFRKPSFESDIENKIASIVEKVIDNKINNLNPNSSPIGPRYSQILKSNLTKSTEPVTAPAKLPQSNYKVIVKPNESLKNVKSSEDTRKILTSKSPHEFGIKVNKIVPIRNNAILIESTCSSILNLTDSPVLKSLNLQAERINKVWPKIQVFDVPKEMVADELIKEIQKQPDLPGNIPKQFVKSAFKAGNKEGKTNHWVIEIHPAARNYFIASGSKLFVSWKSLHVRDYLRITRCFKCQKFGHVSKFCNSEKQCGYCASNDHESISCNFKNNEDKHKCSNCERAGQQELNHPAGSTNCPIYKHRMQEALKNIDFDG
ncbi:putative 50 kDa protein in type I retrotransposable element R1DM-like Protein [Tribolium castaneum]|uniref:Putative 50 kDa protein in type I retrotransposable element R1DM-like Protein n=1 Tax=Tribolium castaneum TaxID=7070 RepID=D7ELI2_TRICA|nr:PREDICTED: uncharacterized protein LOC107399134 [Tribolium castaneum]EFA12186.1 putative 50 kDa protein in type I retrotransposable element R1DM-like Protein [Tribolium castaneum]|eukprot:XP_015840326.1 PREDICTED: uncharacterized protein LOC107399134 [Tribolium castaneum]